MTITGSTEQRACAMTRRERVDYLNAAGWRRLGSGGAQTWVRPAEPWRFYTLAAAVRDALEAEHAGGCPSCGAETRPSPATGSPLPCPKCTLDEIQSRDRSTA